MERRRQSPVFGRNRQHAGTLLRCHQKGRSPLGLSHRELQNRHGGRNVNILTKNELRRLLRVKTTVDQAKQLIRRNQKMLDAINEHPEERKIVKIKCPHCSWGIVFNKTTDSFYQCGKCSYKPESKNGRCFQCCEYTFGGFNYKDWEIRDNIDLKGPTIEYKGINSNRTFGQDTLKVIKTWLQGHIEWGQEVIRRAKSKKEAKD
jgi:ribosomal protein S27AE